MCCDARAIERVASKVWLALVCLALLACGSTRERHCSLGAEHQVALSTAKDFDGIALVALGQHAIAVWSEDSGLYGRKLGADGRPLGDMVRLGARCEGGVDALALADAQQVHIACSMRPSRAKQPEPGRVVWLVISETADLMVRERATFGQVGSLSEGISIARGANGFELVWHDGSADAQRVWWVAFAAPSVADKAVPKALSEGARVAAAPSIVIRRGRSQVTWGETWVEGEKLHSQIVLWTAARGARGLLSVGNFAAMPRLVDLGDRMVLGFRDRRDNARTGLYVVDITDESAPLPELVRVGRADGTGRPTLCACMQGLTTATPRTYGGDYFIGINWLDPGLVRNRGEQQFYEDSHAFTQVSSACFGDHALLFIAEFPQLHRQNAALRAVSYRCR